MRDLRGKSEAAQLAKGEVEKLLDTSVPGTSIADFGYVPGERLLVVPTFLGNTLAAYKIDN